MKTIEERIQEYVSNAWVELDQFNEDHVTFENIVTSACIVGANFERDELLRWRDPKVELPNDNRDVLVKTTLCREYCIAFYKANGGRNHHWHENNGSLDDDMVIGWRPILENE